LKFEFSEIHDSCLLDSKSLVAGEKSAEKKEKLYVINYRPREIMCLYKGTSINYIFDVPLWAHYLIKSGVIIFDNNETPDF